MGKFAPMYSRTERLRLALMLAAILIPLFLLAHFWIIPWLTHYASYANCYQYGGYNGVEILIYGVLVGAPLLLALLLLLLLGPRSLRIVRTGQDPLPGEKVLRKTRYRYGKSALLFPLATLAILLACMAMASWGAFQVDKLVRDIVPCSEQQQSDLGITVR